MALPMDVSRFMALSVSSIIMVLVGRYASRPLMSSPSNFATMPLPDLYLRLMTQINADLILNIKTRIVSN